MITILVSGPSGEREKLAAKVAELMLYMGKPTLHYPKVDLRPASFPEGLEVAIFETSSTPEISRA